MKDSHAEIRAIQAKLQAIQAGRSSLRQPSASGIANLADKAVATASKAATTVISPPLASSPDRADAPSSDPNPVEHYQADYNREELIAAIETLQQRSADYLQQFRQLRPQPTSQPPKRLTEQQISEAFKRLEAKAQYINELAMSQEAAMLEFRSIAEKLERDWKAIEREDHPTADLDAEIPAICEFLEAIVPHIEKDDEGTFVLTARSVDLFRAEREAAMTAQTLRHRLVPPSEPSETKRHRPMSVVGDRPLPATSRVATPASEFWQALGEQCLIFLGIKNAAPRRRRRRQTKAANTTFGIQDAVLWFIGAATVRIALNLVLASFPGFWLPIAAFVVVPVAIAIYRTSSTPQSNLVWGYRLLVVMLGLLIGGRLS